MTHINNTSKAISFNKKIFFFLISILIITLINLVFYFFWIKKFPFSIDADHNLIPKELSFGFGNLLDNLLNQNEYFIEYGHGSITFKGYLLRMPFLPFFIKFVYLNISSKYFLILLFKNILFLTIILLLALKKIKSFFFLFLFFFLIIYNPHNIFTLTSLFPEEGYLGYLLIIFYFAVTQFSNKLNIIFLGIVLFLIYITKASMTYFCYTFAIYLFFFYKKKYSNIFSIFPLTLLLIAYVSWSTFGFIKINKIISPFSISSMNGITLIVSSNTEFNKLYPLHTPDVLEPKMWHKYENELKSNYEDELDVNKFFLRKSFDYIIDNKLDFSISILKKLHIIFFNIKKDAQLVGSSEYNTVRYSTILNKIIFLLSVFIILIKIFKKKLNNEDIIFILIFLSYTTPYLVGFIYERHMVPIYVISHLYLFFFFIKKFKFKVL